MEPQRLHRLAFEANPCQESPPPLDDALALNRDDPKILRRLAESCLGQGELDQALDHFRRIAELCPIGDSADRPRPHGGTIGKLACRCQLLIGGRLHSIPGLPRLTANLPSFYANWRSPRGARLSTRRGPRPGPLRKSYNTLGIVLTDMNKLAGGDSGFPALSALKPDSALTAVDLGYFFVKCGDIPAAADAYRWATKLDPNLYAAHLRLGTALTQLGDRVGAWECYHRARALSPGSSEVITYMGLLHLSEGNFRLGWANMNIA